MLNSYITKKPLRIKQRQVPNYTASSNGVDYLIVYNKLFETQAEQLRAYRSSHDGFRSVKAEMEDIYDIFNYGIENPIAVRNFIKYINENWQQPRISYICLFGRGSLDPKKNSTSSVYYQNYIPVFGNPPTDGFFANMNYGTFAYYRRI
ncbi:MAG: C25 family cysteine peptidase [Ignavibacteriae bacterium]|nr:C25 family cysteine peptidase [Ignavibacteriota bacterium]